MHYRRLAEALSYTEGKFKSVLFVVLGLSDGHLLVMNTNSNRSQNDVESCANDEV